ncbi:MAG: VCBS repeat-containing protein, partial [Armatimonadetes bacterium]|nr:VCBS repeat-containing protein [Armatimonadota bacterium]
DFEVKMGVALPVKPIDEATGEDLAARTCIIAGNLGTDALSMRLYARRLIYSDAAFPGAGGHELRTVHDPWGTGRNVIYLGGSDPEGVRAAGESLLAMIEPGGDVVLDPVVDWQCEAVRYGAVSDESIAEAVVRQREYLASFKSIGQYKNACGRAMGQARAYYLSGEESRARYYEALMRDLASYWEEHDLDPPTFVLPDIVTALDQVEECPAFSDEARLINAEWLRQIIDRTMGYWEMRGPVQREANGIREPAWNHQTHPALGVLYAVEYFKSHNPIPQVAWWARVVTNLFEGQRTSYKPLEDSANYQWITMYHTMFWALVSGRMEYFDEGVLRNTAELAIACHDNFGHESTHGDAWMPFGSNAANIFKGAWLYYHDPRYNYMLELMGRLDRPSLGAYNSGGETEVPADHVGLRTFILDPAVHAVFTTGAVPAERSLDKAVFRGGWDVQDQYLVLDGISVGNHGHRDANAIIRFCDNGRLWLCDMDYIRATPKWHNSITVARDGVTQTQPPLCELTCAAARGDVAMVQSKLPGYAWTDWTRSIFWVAEDCFVVLDELQATEPGSFRTECVWRTLGEETLDGRRLDVEQDGERFHIVNADGSRPVLRRTWDRGHGGDRGYYLKYDVYPQKYTKNLYQNKLTELQAGDTIRYANLFYTDSVDAPRHMDLRVIDERRVLVARDGEPMIVGLGPWEANGVRIDAAMFILTPTQAYLAGAEGQPEPSVDLDAATLQALLREAVASSKQAPEPTELDLLDLPAEMPLAWETNLGSEVTCTAFWGVSAPAMIAAGTDDGRTVLLSPDGEVLWQQQAEAMVRCVAFCDLQGDGRPEIVSGADDAKVRAFAEDGRLLWQVEIQPFHSRTGSVATVFAADLDGDGDDEVVLGSDNHHYYGLAGDGAELWRANTVHASTQGAAGDIDGDGRDEIVAGTEYYWPKLLDDDGKVLRGATGGPNWPTAAVLRLGNASVATLGSDDGRLVLVGERGWEANLGGTVTAVVTLASDAGGASVVASSEAACVYGFTDDGELLWRTQLPEHVTGLVSLNNRVAAACDDGTVYLLGPDGAILAGYREPAVMVGPIAAGDLHGAGSTAVIAGYGTRVVAMTAP